MSEADLHSDRGRDGLMDFALAFLEAHRQVPYGLSVEVGTRNGGSALLFLSLLSWLYPISHRPCLFTVDPYGSKPYNGGDVSGVPIYTDMNYIMMKKLLAPWPNHSHYFMRSEDFFTRLHHLPYWRPGVSTMRLQSAIDNSPVSAPIGDRFEAKDLAFCLLDGEHDALTIDIELTMLFSKRSPWMAKRGIAVVDNVNVDPKTYDMLDAKFQTKISTNGQWAIIRGIK